MIKPEFLWNRERNAENEKISNWEVLRVLCQSVIDRAGPSGELILNMINLVLLRIPPAIVLNNKLINSPQWSESFVGSPMNDASWSKIGMRQYPLHRALPGYRAATEASKASANEKTLLWSTSHDVSCRVGKQQRNIGVIICGFLYWVNKETGKQLSQVQNIVSKSYREAWANGEAFEETSEASNNLLPPQQCFCLPGLTVSLRWSAHFKYSCWSRKIILSNIRD